jgi:hypothetical protein
MSILKDEVTIDPLGVGYASFLSDAPGTVVDLLNSRIYSMNKERYVTSRTIMAECASSSPILTGLKAAAGSDVQTDCAWTFLNSSDGLDIGNPKALAMCDALVTSGAWTSAQAAEVKALASQPASRAEVLGLGYVTEADLRTAMES